MKPFVDPSNQPGWQLTSSLMMPAFTYGPKPLLLLKAFGAMYLESGKQTEGVNSGEKKMVRPD